MSHAEIEVGTEVIYCPVDPVNPVLKLTVRRVDHIWIELSNRQCFHRETFLVNPDRKPRAIAKIFLTEEQFRLEAYRLWIEESVQRLSENNSLHLCTTETLERVLQDAKIEINCSSLMGPQ